MTKKIDPNDFLDKQPNGCWLWTGSLTHDGYPRAGARYMHRVVYEMYKGYIPEKMTLDHLCRVRHCCNPDHLEPITLKENIARGNYGWRSKLTHCKHGHEFTVENTIIRKIKGPNGEMRRDCRECGRIAQRKYQKRLKELKRADNQ